jgi:hypothetical protein
MARLDVFSVHQPIIGDFPTKPPDVQKSTKSAHARWGAAVAANIAKLPQLLLGF